VTISENLAAVRAEIARAAAAANRSANSITLLAVSKLQPVKAIEQALAAGQRVFGENRVQETEKKFPALRLKYPDLAVHLIGPLQTNKVKQAVALFDAIHSVDRAKLAEALGHEMRAQNRRLPCFIEVNIGQEPQKAGISPHDADAFVLACRERFGIPVAGLMCIPPADHDPLPYFRQLAALAKRCGVSCLSMGMSGDYAAAISAGASHVRVGTAIFGERPKPPVAGTS
jgi:pyridoxal phosphate enzyme (YggS family)